MSSAFKSEATSRLIEERLPGVLRRSCLSFEFGCHE